MQIAYFPILLGSVALFMAGEIIMIPFVYMKMVFHKLTMVWAYSKSWRLTRATKFTNFIAYIVFGFLTAVGNAFIDLQFFIRHNLRYDL